MNEEGMLILTVLNIIALLLLLFGAWYIRRLGKEMIQDLRDFGEECEKEFQEQLNKEMNNG